MFWLFMTIYDFEPFFNISREFFAILQIALILHFQDP